MNGRGWWGRHWDSWLGDAVLLLLTAASAYLGQWAGRESGGFRVWLGIGCALAALGAAWVKVAQTRRGRAVRAERLAAEEARRQAALSLHARDLTTFGSALKPGIENLARLATAQRNSNECATAYAAIRNRMVDAASTLTGRDGVVRAVFFRRDDVDGVPRLVPAEYSGARQPSGRLFRDQPEDLAGQAVWTALRLGKVQTWPDVSAEAPPGWDTDTQSRPYRTFTMAPVLGPDRQIYGMLNVDALEPNAFDRLDEERLAAFAALLGAAAHVVADP